MLYLIGLGLNFDSISTYGLMIAKRCKKIYLESYTVDFPYSKKKLDGVIGKKIEIADREFTENLEILNESVKKDVALLVYGSPLTATTHITLLEEAKKSNIKVKVIYNASIFDAVAETGLQLYKFGKISSIPQWEENHRPDSFAEIIKQNQSIEAHTLLLIDIGLDFPGAIKQLKEACKNHSVKIKDLIICQALGTVQRRIYYGSLEEMESRRGVRRPYCLVVPGKLHFLEKEVLDGFK
jgi:diphthine synthase